MPEVFVVRQATGGLFAIADACVPGSRRFEAGPGDAIRTLEHVPVRRPLDGRCAVGEPLAVDVAPGAERLELEAHALTAAEPVNDLDGGATVDGRELPLDEDVADLPPPARDPILEVEPCEELVPDRIDRA